eukprot:Hpha_TRINITY_DN3693_c0_g2::TRINITY_DN3693_c0_g2_i1::g.951::m.951
MSDRMSDDSETKRRLAEQCAKQERARVLKNLRPYQRELYRKVMQNTKEGHSSIVVCPTGTGKTRVAVAAAVSFLSEARKEDRRPVVFLVCTVALVSQQAQQFRGFLLDRQILECTGG